MLKNYLKIAARNLLRYKFYSFLNIAGLAIGMACSILILMWVQDEVSYDRFHSNADHLFRITSDVKILHAATSPPALAEAMKAEIPEVTNAARLSSKIETIFKVENIKNHEKRGFYADPSFLQMFSYPLVEGNSHTALTRPDGIIITEALAKKYFNEKEALGKAILVDNKDLFVVTGVLKNIPGNSHLQFDYLLPMAFLAKTDHDLINNVWDNFNFYTYVQADGESLSNVTMARKVLNEKANALFKKNEAGINLDLKPQPLGDIHLHSKMLADVGGHGDIQYVRILSVTAIFILVIACINFMNLATARSGRRAKEVGLRKVIGAKRKDLFYQFLGESLLLSCVGLVLAIAIVALLLPGFNNLSGKSMGLEYFIDGNLIIGLLAITLFTGLLAGSYPATFLSSFQPVKVLKGAFITNNGSTFRNGLVVVQFVISIIMIVGTTVVYNQLQFIKAQNLGFDKENLLYVPLTGNWREYRNTLKAELEQNSLTNNITITSALPTDLVSGEGNLDWEGKDPEVQHIFSNFKVDESFFEIFKVELISGRSFSRDFRSDTANFILNEKALQEMGMDAASAIGQKFTVNDVSGEIVGVVKDFHFKPVHQPIEPLFLRYNRGGGLVVVKTLPGKTEATIAVLEDIWQKHNPAHPFDYNFVDQDIANLYQTEQRMGSLFNAFAALAIVISCLGLYGLAAFTAEQRTKEIGIRKTLGASVANITRLLSGDFLKLVLLAIVLATPLSWFIMNKWLEGFAYKTDIGAGIFLVAGIAAVLVASITVSFESVKAALTDPVKSLKSE